MTREEFLERIFEIVKGLCIDESYELGQLYDEVTKPHWISMEDELPEENEWVLTYNGSSINLLMLAGNGGWYDHSVAKHRNISHWMPTISQKVVNASTENVKEYMYRQMAESYSN